MNLEFHFLLIFPSIHIHLLTNISHSHPPFFCTPPLLFGSYFAFHALWLLWLAKWAVLLFSRTWGWQELERYTHHWEQKEKKQALKECVSILYRSLKLLGKGLINATKMCHVILQLFVLNAPSLASNLGLIRTNCKVSQEQQQQEQEQEQEQEQQQQLTHS